MLLLFAFLLDFTFIIAIVLVGHQCLTALSGLNWLLKHRIGSLFGGMIPWCSPPSTSLYKYSGSIPHPGCRYGLERALAYLQSSS